MNTTVSFSESYRAPIRRGVVWYAALFLVFVTAGREANGVSATAGMVYAILLLLIMLRRPTAPTRTDLVVVSWAVPILWIVMFLVAAYRRSF